MTETSRLYRELQEREAEIRALKDQLYRENLALRDEVDRTSMFEEIVGASEALKSVLTRLAKVAPTDSTVLIAGETGTGKELTGARCSQAIAAIRPCLRQRELCRTRANAHRFGAIRPRARCVHGSHEPAVRTLRARGRRHDVPG